MKHYSPLQPLVLVLLPLAPLEVLMVVHHNLQGFCTSIIDPFET